MKQLSQYRAAVATTLAAVILVIALLVTRARSQTSAPLQSKSHAAPILLVESATAQAESTTDAMTLTGDVQPLHSATIAAEVAERITARPINRGDRVVAGEPIAQLFSDTALAAQSQAVASLEQARAARRQAQADYDRAVVETAAAQDQAREQFEQAVADERRARAEATLASASQKKTLSYTRRQEMQQAEAALDQAKTDEHLAKVELDRYVYLVGQGAAAQEALDRARATFDSAAARRRSAEQALSLAQEGARSEDRDAAAAQVVAAQAQDTSALHRIQESRAAVHIANTRNVRLAALRAQIDSLSAQVAQAQAVVEQATIAVNKRTVRAPVTGRILATLEDAGDMASVGAPIATVGEISQVKATFFVPEAVRPGLKVGSAFDVTADALPGRRFHGRITALGYQADSHTRGFPVELTIDNPGERLLPNMVARVHLTSGGMVARISVPVAAVAGEGSQTCVYVLHNGIATRRTVRLGAPQGDRVEILDGLTSGEKVALTPQRLSDGANVREAE
jgi:RND family efflux transporter MFP subunit